MPIETLGAIGGVISQIQSIKDAVSSAMEARDAAVFSEKAVELLEGVESGDTSRDELDILPELGETLEQTSICGLGQVALNPILSMLRHFPEAVPGKPGE